jgi:hypothetical protein
MPKLSKIFPKIEFIEADSTETLQNHGRDLKILDVAQGISEIKIAKFNKESNMEMFQTDKIFSMHDFDLGYNLKLLKSVGKIDSAEIICLPMRMTEEEALNQVQLILRKWVAHDMQGS